MTFDPDSSSENASLTMPVSKRDHIQGLTDAPLTLVEYGDYECPACGQAYPTIKAIQHAAGKQLRFVFRNFPLVNAHPYAEHAAEAAESAGTRGRFWEMHDLLFENQAGLEDQQLASKKISFDVSFLYWFDPGTKFDGDLLRRGICRIFHNQG